MLGRSATGKKRTRNHYYAVVLGYVTSVYLVSQLRVGPHRNFVSNPFLRLQMDFR